MPSHEPTHGSARGDCTNAVGFSAAGGAGIAGGNAGNSTGAGGSGSSVASAGFSDGACANGMRRARSGGGGSGGRGDADECEPDGSQGERSPHGLLSFFAAGFVPFVPDFVPPLGADLPGAGL